MVKKIVRMTIAPLAGMQAAQLQVDRSATRIASVPTATQSGSDSIDLSAEAVNLIQAKNNFAAQVKTLISMDNVTKALLDVVG